MLQQELSLCNEILHLYLRPWVEEAEEEPNFEELAKNEIAVPLSFLNSFEVSMDEPTTSKQAYYAKVVERDAFNFLNDLDKQIKDLTTKSEKQYSCTEYFNYLEKILHDARPVIQSQNDNLDSDHKYILHVLKHHLAWIYLEMQEQYREFLQIPILRSDEIYFTYFGEDEPTPEIIIGAIHRFGIQTSEIKTRQPNTKFKPIQDDFRPTKADLLTYKEVVKTPERFCKMEEYLYRDNIIDKEYNFQNLYGRKYFLAAVYHQMVTKGYFHSRVFPGNIEIKPANLISFLDHRYNTDVNKQFRLLANDSKKLQKYTTKVHWLDNLPPC